MSPPFSLDYELYHKLHVDPTTQILGRSRKEQNPALPKKSDTLPGHPLIHLSDPHIGNFCRNEFATSYLDEFAPYLWLIATQSHSHISSLTHQIVRGRSIVLTEDPNLHLLWYYDRVFIKPLPSYLTSEAFWSYYLLDSSSPIPQPLRSDITQSARGYLRTWAYLIQHRSDFALATSDPKLQLLPKNVTFGELMRFLGQCKDSISGIDVNPRYRFGELRISRINVWSQILLKRFSYHKASGQYGGYFSRYFGLILFLFAVFSTILSAMQVALAALTFLPAGNFGRSWNTVLTVSGWFSVVVMICVAGILFFLGGKLVFMIGRETVFALKTMQRKRKL